MTAPPRGQGTAQPERASPLGSAAALAVDGLPREATLAFAAQLAALVRHAPAPDEPGGADASFAPFFAYDLEIQLALIATFRPEVAAAPLRGEIARLSAGSWALGAGERARVVPAVSAALGTLDTWWERLQGPPGVSGLGPVQHQVEVLAPFARQHKQLVQQRVVGPLQDLLAAAPALFEIMRGLDPGLWGPVARGTQVDLGDPPASLAIATLLASLATAIEDTEQQLVAEARRWLASPAVRDAPRPPHLALWLAFVDLLEVPRARINRFAEHHLRYYYETVLGQTPRGATPDRTFVVFKAAATPQPAFLPAGTVLSAGKDAAGKDRAFQLVADVQVDLAAVARLLTLTARPDPSRPSGEVLIATDSRAAGQVAPAEVGFALASPAFALAGGTRRICLTMQVDGVPATPTTAAAFFNVRLTGPAGWVALDPQAVLSGTTLTLDVTLGPAQPAVVGYQTQLHGAQFADGSPPVLVFVLDDTGSPASATALAAVMLSGVQATIHVDGTPAFQLYGPTGPLVLGKPFAPLGYAPAAGAALLVACPEALEKKLTQLTLDLTWQGLPAAPLYPYDVGTYYGGYEIGLPGYVRPGGAPPSTAAPPRTASAPASPPPPLITRGAFQVAVSARQGGAWTLLTDAAEPLALFGSLSETTICLDGSPGHALPSPAPPAGPFQWQPLPADGVLQLQLVAPAYGFGAALYPIATAQLARWNTDYVIDKVKGNAAHPTPPPPYAALNPPLTPLVTALTISYDAEAVLEARSDDDITLYRLSPWIAEPVAMPTASRRIAAEPVALLSDSVRGHVLLAGFTATTPGRTVTCLIVLGQHGQLVAGQPGGPALAWRYYGARGWTALAVEDRTGQLCRSGLISFAVPADAADWPGMGARLVWLELEVIDVAAYAVLPMVSDVLAQATTCARVPTTPPGAYDVPLPAGTIVGLKTGNPKITGVSQPLPTSGGQRAEDPHAMYQRVSERVRHKNRAVTTWDFERLALQRTPSLFAVRCLPGVARQPDGSFQRVDRGVVTLLVSPRIYDPAALSAERYPPLVDDQTLGQIQQDLAALASASAELQVWNPCYVPVTVAARLTAQAGHDPSMIGPRLEAALRAFLSPWIFQPASATALSGPDSTTQIRRFLLGQPEVHAIQSVTCRLGTGPVITGGSLRVPTTPWRIPVTAWHHELTVALSTS